METLHKVIKEYMCYIGTNMYVCSYNTSLTTNIALFHPPTYQFLFLHTIRAGSEIEMGKYTFWSD